MHWWCSADWVALRSRATASRPPGVRYTPPMSEPAPAPVLRDPTNAAFLALTDWISRPRTREDLVALVPGILAATGGRVTVDYGELWARRWDEVTGGDLYPENLWPNV